ncbi:flagellar protein export ATPase FliI [Bosea caraganae]|uniref:Flagellum-specific ATP synthase n=1 Tax=Bosea caraganae TaxID=2763117 RepID=A0A370LC56_9HYPH|nr:flagellar protein export ATPase FliI [Bosea caraganae]RDJ27423.1 flagellar protein export ATPase FliI [Bosea caraganae]RDJ29439.1 flagellar protein export ATPase FliI [Bosea caraganae]
MNALMQLDHALAGGPQPHDLVRVSGAVSEVTPASLRVAGLSRFVKLGERIALSANGREEYGEAIRIDREGVLVKPFATSVGVGLGARASLAGAMELRPSQAWKGRVINAFGEPIDDAGPIIAGDKAVRVDAPPPEAMKRGRVNRPVRTGVKVIDLFTPLCAGQRIGIFAGSGVGKSTLLSMLARAPGFSTIVIGLVGERGREVREFLDDTLGGMRGNAVAVVSTSDESAMMRRLAPNTAMAVAEYFRDQGEDVLLIIDSVTRLAHAARDVALAAGEPAVARGYTPSVFSTLPKLLERAGPGVEGSGAITGIFSVLIDGDDHNDPVADSIRGTLDGHLVLDRAIADQGRYPAVNILGSVSRLAHHVWTPDQRSLAMRIKGLIARFEDTRDLRLMGGYQAGADAELDKAIALVPKIYEALRQDVGAPLSTDVFQDLAAALQS